MFLQGAKAYQEVNVSSAVNSASPVRLIVLLYEGAMGALASARLEMANNNVIAKAKLITRAIDIVNGLRASLDPGKGGEIASSLESLYEYMVRQLTMANLKNDPEILDEVHRLLGELHGAWSSLAEKEVTGQTQQDTR